MRAWLVAALIVSSAAAPAGAAQSNLHHGVLRSYMAKVVPQVKTYLAIGKRATDVLGQDPTQDVTQIADGLSDVSARFARLAARWDTMKAPPGLGLKHRGMGGAFRLQGQAFAGWAEGWRQLGLTQDPAALNAAQEHAVGLLRSATYLQNRWSVALSGALIRAYLPVPRWLEQMAIVVP